MKAKNLLIPRKISPYVMDKNSDRYRVCPNDGEEFMAEHRSEKFCSDHCTDEFHNEKKRLAALEAAKTPSVQTLMPLSITIVMEGQELQPKAIVEAKRDEVSSALMGNINLIGTLLGHRESLRVPMDLLPAKGFQYETYEQRYQLAGTHCYALSYGPYVIAWSEQNKILLTLKKNIPWIQ